jgi:hypothetical protein
VQPVIGLYRSRDKIPHLVCIPYIHFDKKSISSFLLDQLDCFRARWVHIANDNLGAMASEEKRCRAPDTGASPGDKRYFTRKVQLIIAHLSRVP